MGNIIKFPVPQSNGYKNLAALFEVCDNVQSCSFYLESAEYLYTGGHITQRELYTLRRIGRQKRLDLAEPETKEPEKAEVPGTYIYTPEMGQGRPECQMEATRAYYGKHYYIETPIELKGRGITFCEKLQADNLYKSSQYKAGWNRYKVTDLAYEKLEKQYTISRECLLD